MKSARGLVPRAATTAAWIFWLSFPNWAWAQRIQSPAADRGLWIQGVIFGGGALLAYGVMFHIVFSALLWQRSRPLTAYAWAWSLWIGVLTAVFLFAFWDTLIPYDVPPDAIWGRYKWHIGIGMGGFLLSLSPFFLLRKPTET